MPNGNETPQVAPKEEPKTDFKDMLQRLQADFENYKKRVDRETADAKEQAKAQVLLKFLPVLDSFDQAIKLTSRQRTQDDLPALRKEAEDLRKGFELVHKQLRAAFDSEGVKVINAKAFDPYQHDVLMQEEHDAPEGTILEEFQRGYKKGERVLRHAKVKISKGRVKKDELSSK